MNRTRLVLGYVAGVLLIASSALHSLAGWPATQAELAKTNASADLVASLQMGWHFGGVAMLAMGIGVLALFRAAQNGQALQRVPVLAIGAGYLAFGAVEFVLSHYEPFLFIFIVPGALLLAAAGGRATAPA